MPETPELYLPSGVDPQVLRQQCREDLLRHSDKTVHITLSLPVAFALACQIQVALHKPRNSGPSAMLALQVSDAIGQQIAVTDAIQQMLERGWITAYDQTIWKADSP